MAVRTAMIQSSSDCNIQVVVAGFLPWMLEFDPPANGAGFILSGTGTEFSKSISAFPFDCYLTNAVISYIYYRRYLIRMMTSSLEKPQQTYLALTLLMSYIYGAPSKARNLTYIYGQDFLMGILLLEPCISLIYV
jgi:hypothetical protein